MLNAIVVSIRFILLILGGQKQVALENACRPQRMNSDMLRVARTYIDLNHLSIVIVADHASIEGPLKAAKVAPITPLDVDGNPVK
jgi:hypothetical protein